MSVEREHLPQHTQDVIDLDAEEATKNGLPCYTTPRILTLSLVGILSWMIIMTIINFLIANAVGQAMQSLLIGEKPNASAKMKLGPGSSIPFQFPLTHPVHSISQSNFHFSPFNRLWAVWEHLCITFCRFGRQSN
jgi:hypothetical protein